jgi:hypothetical protein
MKNVVSVISKFWLSVFLMAAIMILGAGASAQEALIDLNRLDRKIVAFDAVYSANSIDSSASAETALTETVTAQSELQAWFAQADRACYELFFVNSCLDKNKLTRRRLSDILQRISIEAKAYQRKAHIEELDAQVEAKKAAAPQN